MRKLILSIIVAITIPALALAQAPEAKAKAEQILKQARAAVGDEKKLKELIGLSSYKVIFKNHIALLPGYMPFNMQQIKVTTKFNE